MSAMDILTTMDAATAASLVVAYVALARELLPEIRTRRGQHWHSSRHEHTRPLRAPRRRSRWLGQS